MGSTSESRPGVRRVYPTNRQRPAMRGGRPTLDRTRIAEAALEIAGESGFPAVTMRAVAKRLSVSVAALYKHIPDRQTVIDLATALFLESMPDHRYDPSRDWRETIADTYDQLRIAYRRHPRALLVAMDEQGTTSAVPDSRMLGPERMIAYLRRIGLSPVDAVAVHAQYLLDVFGFVLLIDYPHDHRNGDTPGPGRWADERPHLVMPALDEARETVPAEPDALFRSLVDNAITLIDARLNGERLPHSQRHPPARTHV